MRMTAPALGVMLLLTLSVRGSDDQSVEIARLIHQLGDSRFRTREAASEALEQVGEPALEALRKAAKSSQDPEIRRRASQLMRVCGRLNRVEGAYYLGNGQMRFTLEIQAEGSYRFEWTGCPGLDEKSEGSARMVEGWLILTPEKRQLPKIVRNTPTKFLPVNWGSRTYLLAENELTDFCNSINQKTEPRTKPDGEFCLRGGDWSHDVTGLPTLPKQLSSLVLPKPLHAEVIEVAADRTGKLNVGEKDGVRPGMILETGQNRRYPCSVRVVAVEKDTCTIREVNELIVPDIKKGDIVGSQKRPDPEEPYFSGHRK